MKLLGNFYKILLNLWLNDDYVSVFDQNIAQLVPLFDEIMQAGNEEEMRKNEMMRSNRVLRLFHILRGLFKGASTYKNFSVLFDWFYPEHFGVIKKCLSCYVMEPCDDDVIILILKFI